MAVCTFVSTGQDTWPLIVFVSKANEIHASWSARANTAQSDNSMLPSSKHWLVGTLTRVECPSLMREQLMICLEQLMICLEQLESRVTSADAVFVMLLLLSSGGHLPTR